MKLLPPRRIGPVVTVLAALVVQAAPAAAQTVGKPLEVAGGQAASLRSVSCGSATECVAIGGTIVEDPDPSHLVVVRISGGRVLPANTSSTLGANDIACVTASDCIAVGGAVVPIRNGVPGPARPIPGPGPKNLTGVSCWTASDCVAVGVGSGSTGGQGGLPPAIVVSIENGVPQAPVTVPGVQGLTSVECRSATCQSTGAPALGSFAPGEFGAAVVTIRNGVPGDPVVVRSAGQRVIACPSVTTCLVPFVADPPRPGTMPPPVADDGAKVIPIVNGQPQAARTVGDAAFFIYALACQSATTCTAVGPVGNRVVSSVASFTDFRVAPVRAVPAAALFDVACAGSAGCLAVGGTDGGRGLYNAAVVSLGFKLGTGAPGADVATEPKAAGPGVTLAVRCAVAAGGSCALSGSLTARVNGRPVVVGTKKRTVAGGKTSTFLVRLDAAGRKLLGRTGRLPVTLKVSSRSGGKTRTVVTRKLTLKR